MSLPSNDDLRELVKEMLKLAIKLDRLPDEIRLEEETLELLDDVRVACGRLQLMASATLEDTDRQEGK